MKRQQALATAQANGTYRPAYSAPAMGYGYPNRSMYGNSGYGYNNGYYGGGYGGGMGGMGMGGMGMMGLGGGMFEKLFDVHFDGVLIFLFRYLFRIIGRYVNW